MEVIERCGHMPIIEKPEQVVARMKRFLQRTDGHATVATARRTRVASPT
jgi:hypothetical protein